MKRNHGFMIAVFIWAVFMAVVLAVKATPAEEYEAPVFPVEAELVVVEADPEPRLTVNGIPLYEWKQIEMLATVIYSEAGGDACCDECRRRVADVVLNRVADERFPDTIEEVLTAKRQYGRFYWTGIVWPERASNPSEAHAVERAYRIAEEVWNGQHSELYGVGYIWQSEFKNGTDIIECCGHYFGR